MSDIDCVTKASVQLCVVECLPAMAGRDTNFQVSCCPFKSQPRVCVSVVGGRVSKLLPHLTRRGLEQQLTVQDVLLKAAPYTCSVLRDGWVGFLDLLLDPASLVVGPHVAQPSAEPAQRHLLHCSGARHQVAGRASVTRLADRRDVADEPQVFARLSKGIHVLDVEVCFSSFQRVVCLSFQQPSLCCSDCAVQRGTTPERRFCSAEENPPTPT